MLLLKDLEWRYSHWQLLRELAHNQDFISWDMGSQHRLHVLSHVTYGQSHTTHGLSHTKYGISHKKHGLWTYNVSRVSKTMFYVNIWEMGWTKLLFMKNLLSEEFQPIQNLPKIWKKSEFSQPTPLSFHLWFHKWMKFTIAE